MMFRRILPFALALAVAGPAAAYAASPAETGAPALLQTVEWQGDQDGPSPWWWNRDHDHDRGRDDGHDWRRHDHRGHWVPAHVEWHHHHRIWIPGHWDRA